MKDLLNSVEASHYLKLARQTLARLRCSGGSPIFYKVGRQVLYDRSDLDAWLDARRRRSTCDRGVGAAADLRREHPAAKNAP